MFDYNLNSLNLHSSSLNRSGLIVPHRWNASLALARFVPILLLHRCKDESHLVLGFILWYRPLKGLRTQYLGRLFMVQVDVAPIRRWSILLTINNLQQLLIQFSCFICIRGTCTCLVSRAVIVQETIVTFLIVFERYPLIGRCHDLLHYTFFCLSLEKCVCCRLSFVIDVIWVTKCLAYLSWLILFVCRGRFRSWHEVKFLSGSGMHEIDLFLFRSVITYLKLY